MKTVSLGKAQRRRGSAFRVIVPKAVQFAGIWRAIISQESIAGDIWFTRRDLPLASLRRREIEVRIVRMNSKRLRRTEIVRMAKHGQSGKLPIDAAADRAPARHGIVTGDAVFAFGCQEEDVFLDSPLTMAANTHAAITILGKNERAGRCAFLCGYEIEHRIPVEPLRTPINRHFPELVQCGLSCGTAQIDVA